MRMICSSRFCSLVSIRRDATHKTAANAYLESLILKNTLNGGVLVGRRKLCLENDAEGAISNNLALSILYLSRLASNAVLNLLLDDL